MRLHKHSDRRASVTDPTGGGEDHRPMSVGTDAFDFPNSVLSKVTRKTPP